MSSAGSCGFFLGQASSIEFGDTMVPNIRYSGVALRVSTCVRRGSLGHLEAPRMTGLALFTGFRV